MFAVRILFILTPLSYCKCYSFRVHDSVINNQVNKIIHSYVKPLSVNFPNHEVEIQVEIGDSPTRLTPRRRVFVYKPGALLRAGPTSGSTQTTTYASITTTPHKTVPLATEAPILSTVQMEKPDIKTQSTRLPIYREDLVRALDELEKKLNMQTIAQGQAVLSYNKGTEDTPQLVISNPGPVHSNQNINRIIDLMKKGVQFQRHVPKPDDDDLEWIQIKIPKY